MLGVALLLGVKLKLKHGVLCGLFDGVVVLVFVGVGVGVFVFVGVGVEVGVLVNVGVNVGVFVGVGVGIINPPLEQSPNSLTLYISALAVVPLQPHSFITGELS